MPTFRNPIIGGFHPDPSVCRVGDDYFLATSSFEYFPGVPIYHSRDLVNWKLIGHALSRASQLPLNDCGASSGIWAPTIRHHDGVFYVVTTNMNHGGNFYVSTRDPRGEWSEPIWFDKDGWDPSLFFDDDGTAIVSRSGHTRDASGKIHEGVVQYEIDIKTGEKLSTPRVVWEGTGSFGAEAPHLYKIGGWYYLMIAEGSTHIGHLETIARSREAFGPFEACPHNPILTQRHRLLDRILATAHADLVQARDGSWHAVFLGIRNFSGPVHPKHHLGRETFLAPVTWTEDGWPLINNGEPITPHMPAPSWPMQPFAADNPRDDFAGATFALEWTWLRNPRMNEFSLSERPGWLRLRSSGVGLDEKNSPTWIGRRQQHTDCIASTRLDFTPQSENDEAGITVFATCNFHVEIGVRADVHGREIFVRRTAGRWTSIAATHRLSDGEVTLRIEADPWNYNLFFSQGDADPQFLAQVETTFLSTEISGSFTGVFFALYAVGQPHTPADFDWFEYLIGEERD